MVEPQHRFDFAELTTSRPLLELLPDFVVLASYDADARALVISDVNSVAEEVLGRSRDQLVGARLRSLLADESLFESDVHRERFLRDLYEREQIEFPGLTELRNAEGERRYLRVRLRWPKGTNSVVVIGEDLTRERAISLEHAGAERLRTAAEISGLMSHHLNNALTVAMIDLEAARARKGTESTERRESLDNATRAVEAAAAVLSALTVTTQVSAEVAQSCALAEVLLQSLREVGCGAEVQQPAEECFVWGSRSQIEASLRGFVPILIGDGGSDPETRVELEPLSREVVVRLRVRAPRDTWLWLLLDPARPQLPHDVGSQSMQLFASAQVLRAMGGRLSLPRRTADGLIIELTLPRAPELVTPVPEVPPLWVVTPDASLRAVVSTLTERPVLFTDDIRDGLARLSSAAGQVVLCDIDRLAITAEEVQAFFWMLHGPGARGLILARRGEPEPTIELPQVTIPLEGPAIAAALQHEASHR